MNKYRRGRKLSFKGLIKELEACRYVYIDTRPQHWGWLREMSFNTLFGLVRHGRFYKTIETNNNKKGEK